LGDDAFCLNYFDMFPQITRVSYAIYLL